MSQLPPLPETCICGWKLPGIVLEIGSSLEVVERWHTRAIDTGACIKLVCPECRKEHIAMRIGEFN
jgi:hypothetical protein